MQTGITAPGRPRGSRAPRVPKATEAQVQSAVRQHLTLMGVTGLTFFSVPNEGQRSKASAGRLKANGLTAGVPDLILIRDGRAYGLELKTEKGRLSPAQRDCHDTFRAAGATVAVAYGLDEALGILRAWGMLRR